MSVSIAPESSTLANLGLPTLVHVVRRDLINVSEEFGIKVPAICGDMAVRYSVTKPGNRHSKGSGTIICPMCADLREAI